MRILAIMLTASLNQILLVASTKRFSKSLTLAMRTDDNLGTGKGIVRDANNNDAEASD